jgi:sialic acid synthase SpsE
MAATRVPVILSTGMADWMEIQRGVDACRGEGNADIVLLQCTSLYPAPVDLSNLRAIPTMRQAFGVLTGYSDHTHGDHVSIASVAMGACMIEKHFSMNRKLPGPDHSFAIEPGELKDMVKRVRDIESALGDGVKNGPRAAERDMYEKARRSLHAAKPIAKGERITDAHLTAKRPGLGIPPYLREQVIGRVAKADIPADQWITWDVI